MTTVTLTKNESDFVEKAGSAYYVVIETDSIEESWSKKLQEIPYPATKLKRRIVTHPIDGSSPPYTIIIDIVRIIHEFKIHGHIVSSETTTSGSSGYRTAQQVKSDLVKMFEFGGTMTLNIGSDSYTVNIRNMSIKESPSDEIIPTRYDVDLTLVEGVDKP